MRALFDVNVLLALFDSDHTHHPRAEAWRLAHFEAGWASCPLTQNGFLRVISQRSYPRPIGIGAAFAGLAAQTRLPGHAFWPNDLSLLDDEVFNQSRVLGPKQLTDIYLLGLATCNGGRLVTFDRGLAVASVKSATSANLVVI